MQLTWDASTFATVPLVKARCEDAGILLQKSGDQLDTIIKACIGGTTFDDAKYDLKKHLFAWARDLYPDTVEKWQNLVGYNFGRYRERFDLDKISPSRGGAWIYDGFGFVGILNANPATFVPQMFYTNTVPADGDLNTVADNGARLDYISTTGAQLLYINRGTLTATVWQRANHRDAVNWILNSEVLIEPHVCATMRRLAEKGIFSNRVNYQDQMNKMFALDTEAFWQTKFLETLYGVTDPVTKRTKNPGILKDLEIDFSGDGLMSDFEMSEAGDEHFGFA